MAIIYSYPLQNPKLADLLIGTSVFDENIETSPKNNPTVSFTVQSLINLVATSTGAQNLQQVTNIGAITTNVTTFSTDIKVTGRYYDSADVPGTAGQLLSSTLTGTSWIAAPVTGVTSIAAYNTVLVADRRYVGLVPTATTTGAVQIGLDITGMTDIGAFVTGPDIMVVTDDVAGFPYNKKITVANLKTFINDGTVTSLTTTGTSGVSTLVAGVLNIPNYTYALPLAADGTRGGVQIGYVQNAKNYPIELSSEKMFVNVPWTDTLGVTTFTNVNGTYVSASTVNTTATGAVTVGTLDLSAVDGTSDATTKFLSKDNTWDVPSYSDPGVTTFTNVNGTYVSAGTVNTAATGGVTVGTIDLSAVDGTSVALTRFLSKDNTWDVPFYSDPGVESFTNVNGTFISAGTVNTSATGAVTIGTLDLSATGTPSSTTYLRGDNSWGAIPTGLIFKDVWDARDATERGSGSDGGDPDLRLLTPADGWLYIVNIAGSATPNGAATTPSSWNLGDWCIYNGTAWTRVPATNSGVTTFTSTQGTYIDITANVAATGAVGLGTVDLNATGTPGATTYLRGDNAWVIPPNTEYLAMTSTVLGLGKLFDDTEQTVAATAVSTTASRTYGTQMNSSDQLVVNIPWTDTQNPFQTLTGTGTNNTDSGVLLSDSGGTVLVLGATGIAASQTGNTITLTGTTYALSGVGTDNTDSGIRLTGTGTSAANTDVLILGSGATTVSQIGNTITINSASGSYSWIVRDSVAADKTVLTTEYLKFETATGTLGTALTGTGTTLDPYLMTLTSPNTQNPFQTITGTGSGNTDSGILLSNSGGTVLVLGAGSVTASQTGNTITLTGTDSNETYDLNAGAKVSTSVPINLTSTSGTDNSLVNLTEGTNITLTRNSGTQITIDASDTNTQNEYATSWIDDLVSNSLIALRLTESGAGSGTQDINIIQGSNVTFTYTDANNITIAATDTNDNTTYAFSITDPGGTNSNLTITPSVGTPQTIAFTGGTNMDIVPGTNQMTFNSTNTMGSGFTVSADTNTAATTITEGDTLTLTGGTNVDTVSNPDGTITINSTDQYSGTVTSITAGIGLETATGSPITTTGTILVDYGPGTGNVITFSNAGVAGGTIDKAADYFMWSDTSDAKTVKHSLIQDLPFASASASGTVTSVSGGDGITVSGATTVTPVVSVDYTTTLSANLISSALSSAITVPDDDEILILKSSGSSINTVERTKVSKLNFTNNTGTLTAVTGTAPVVSSGGTTPAISMAAATGSVNGYLTSADWTTFNNKTSNSGTVTSVGGTGTVSGLTLTGTVTTSGNLTLGGTLSLTSLDITTGLGFTPYNATNPAGYTSNTGTVTSITAAADSGSGSAITTSGTLTFSGGTNVTTSVSGTTVTINSTDQYVGTVTGTGTANYVSKWSSGSAQTNSLLRDDGIGLSVGDSADANYTFYINDQYGYKSNISVNAGVGFYATCAGVLTGTLFKGEASSGVVMTMLQNGTLEVTGDLIAYGTPSDKRLKENIKPIEKALDKVEKLEGVTFDWKENDKEVRQTWIHDIGFIAQDVQKVIPELVRENEDGLLSMRHQGITPILVEAIKELKQEIEELKSKPCNCNNCNCK